MEQILIMLKAKAKHIALVVLLILGGLFGFKACRKHDIAKDNSIASTVLPPNDKEKIIVDPIKHTITVVTRDSKGQDHSKTTYLPDGPTSITEDNSGKLTVQERKWGSEIRPYLGVGGDLSMAPRLHLGLDAFYWHRFDLGVGLGMNMQQFKDVRPNLNISYNFYSNTSIAFSIDNHKDVGVFLKLRF